MIYHALSGTMGSRKDESIKSRLKGTEIVLRVIISQERCIR